MSSLSFTVLGHPQPQGSMQGLVSKGKVVMKSDNAAMKPWRQEVGWSALRARSEAGCSVCWAGRHVPVAVEILFVLAPPKGKKRFSPAVRPDLDKLVRSIFVACSGILWADDGQVVKLTAEKVYGLPERAEIRVSLIGEKSK